MWFPTIGHTGIRKLYVTYYVQRQRYMKWRGERWGEVRHSDIEEKILLKIWRDNAGSADETIRRRQGECSSGLWAHKYETRTWEEDDCLLYLVCFWEEMQLPYCDLSDPFHFRRGEKWHTLSRTDGHMTSLSSVKLTKIIPDSKGQTQQSRQSDSIMTRSNRWNE